MKNFTDMSVKTRVLILALWIFILPKISIAQCACTPTGAFPTTVNGITISLSNTGSVSNYGANWPSCGLSAGPIWVGSTGAFTQTFTFSQPVNNVNYVITAASGGESFSFAVGSGVLSTTQCGGTCPFTQVGNTFTCNGNNDGTTVVLSSSTPYTSITISGPGGSNGSIVGLCVESIVICSTPTLNIIPSAAVCLGASRTLTVSGAASYTWSPAASLSIATGSVVAATPTSATTYTVMAGTGNCTTTAMTTVSVTPSPTIAISPSSASICSGSSATLSAMGAGSYTWSPSAGLNNENLSTVVATPANTTSYTVTGANSICTNTAMVVVNVTAMPVLTITPQTSTICSGSSATLSAMGAGNYTWSPSAGLNNENLSTVVATPASTTVYTITGANGLCTTTSQATINVITVPVLTLTPSSASICSGSSATLSAMGAGSYTWSPSAGLNNENLSTVVATPANTTSYTVTGANSICTNTAMVVVNVTAMPVLTITPQTSTICSGSSATLSAMGAGSYTWSPSASLNNENLSAVVATPASTTVYTITGANGLCTTTSQATINVITVPVLTLTPSSASICSGSSATLSAMGAGSYTWSPSASLNNENLSTVVATPANTTSYTVTGANSICTNTAMVVVNVIANPTLTTVPNTTVCAGTSATITVSGASTYTWSPTGNLSSSTGSVVVSSPASTETYTITGTLNTCTATASAIVTIVPRPMIVMGLNADICSGTSAPISASGAATYSWIPSSGLSSTTGATVNASPSATTEYTVIGTMAGCSSMGVSIVSVTAMPKIVVSANPSSICRGASSSLTASGAGSYTWIPNSSLSINNVPTTIANPLATTIYTVIGANGLCIATSTVELVVIQTATAQINPVSPICLGSSTKIEAQGGTSYNWLPLTGLSNPNSASTMVYPTSTTVYTVTATRTNFCPGTATVIVVVNPVPNVYAGRDTIVNMDELITLNGTGDVEVAFLSPMGVSLGCNLCDVITVNPQERTCYVLRGENSYGCVNFDTVCVTVTKDYNVYIPNAFTPNGDGYNDVFIPVGYGLSEIRLTIFNRWGALIFTSNETSIGWDGNYKGKLCEQGVYVYQAEIRTMDGNTILRTGHVTLLPKPVVR